MLPSYLQSFNYKLHHNLLPVITLVREYRLDNNSCCLFCGVGPETTFHMFGTCEKMQILWRIASETVLAVTQKSFDFADIRKNLHLDLVCVMWVKIRDEPEAGHVRSGLAGPDVRVRSGPADFRPDLSRISRSFFYTF